MYAGTRPEVSPLHVMNYGRYGAAAGHPAFTAAGGSVTGGTSVQTSNRALYFPMFTPVPLLVARMIWVNINTTGNADAGVYDAAGTRLTSTGSTVRSGANAAQYTDVTDVVVLGQFYLAIASNNTGTFGGVSVGSTPQMEISGQLMEESAFPLPSTMTPVASTSASPIMVGFTQDASV